MHNNVKVDTFALLVHSTKKVVLKMQMAQFLLVNCVLLVIIAQKVLQHNLFVVHLLKIVVLLGQITVQRVRLRQQKFQMDGLVPDGPNHANHILEFVNVVKVDIVIAMY
jgi:hypothetical protein